MSDRLHTILSTIEIWQSSFIEPTSVLVTDKEKILVHYPANFDNANITKGMPLDEIRNESLTDAFETGKVQRFEVGPEKFGFPFVCTYSPIIEKGEVIGIIITTTSIEKIGTLRSMATELAATVEEMNATTDEVGDVSNKIAENIREIANESDNIAQISEEAFKSIQLVEEIASRSQILGLNAAIEAARAGEYGRGFSIVADEIRKLAEQSGNGSAEIVKLLEGIKEAVTKNSDAIQTIVSRIEEHSASIQELKKLLIIFQKLLENY